MVTFVVCSSYSSAQTLALCPLQGPKGEAVGSITQPLPSSHLIFRAASESDGKRAAVVQTLDTENCCQC